MTTNTATAESGSNGATVSTGDAGTPAWDAVPIGASCTFTYSSAGGCIRGALCYAYSVGVTSATTYAEWNVNAGASTATQYQCLYLDPADFSGAPLLARGMDSAGSTQRWRLVYSAGTVILRDSGNATIATSSSLSSGTRYRVEWQVQGTTTGAARLFVYVGESTTATYDSGAQSGNFGGAIQRVRVGQGAAATSVSGKVDDFGWSDSAALGPAVKTSGAIAMTMPIGATAAGSASSSGATGSAAASFTLSMSVAGSAFDGVALMPRQLGPGAYLAVEAAFGADLADTTGSGWVWTDITTSVRYGQRVNITQGRADETSQASPASCSFTLLNPAGDFTPYAPASRYYPNVRRNTPIRVRVTLNYGLTWYTRFEGYAAGWTPGWDPSAKVATVAVTAAGVLRRLTQGKTPLKSPLYRAAHAVAPVAAWMLDDASGSTTLASSVGGAPLSLGNAVAGVTDAGLAGVAAVIRMPQSAPATSAVVAPYSMAAGFLGIRLWAKVDLQGNSDTATMTLRCAMSGPGTLGSVDITLWGNTVPPAGAIANMRDTAGIGIGSSLDTGLGFPGLPINPLDGEWHEVLATFTTVGPNLMGTLYLDGQLGAQLTYVGASLNPVTSVSLRNDLIGGTANLNYYSTAAIYNDPAVVPAYAAGDGYAAEDAAARLARLCAEQGVPITVTGASNITMGPQPSATFVELLRQCEAADGGLLYDGFGPGLGYVCRSSRYNQVAALTLHADADPPHIAPPFTPVDDDQRNRNDITASRTGGSSARYVDQTGPLGTGRIGTYDSSVDLNVDVDSGLLDQAAWRVHLGTVEGLRYPSLNMDLLATPALAAAWLEVTLTERVDVVNITTRTTQHPPDDLSLAIEGWDETIDHVRWQVAQNNSPQRPWTVNVVEDAQYGRVETDGSTLAANITSTATSASVASSTAYIWTTTATFPADFPFDIEIGGERITVTAITGGSSPQTFTLTRSVNGVVKAHSAGDAVSLWHPAVIAL
jgi:hypothetical protein